MLKKNNRLKLIIPIVILGVTGCSNDHYKQKVDQNQQLVDQNHKYEIKLLFPSEKQYNQAYGSLFAEKYPNIKVTVIASRSSDGKEYTPDQLSDLIKNEGIDVIYTGRNYKQLADSGLLYPIDNLLKRGDFDIENINPSIIEAIREKSKNGVLYGLSPTFSNEVLAYNKDLFDKYHVSYPKDKMTWEQIIDLAKKFPLQTIHGVYYNATSPYDLIKKLGFSEGLSLINSNNKLMLTDKSWTEIITYILNCIKDKSISLSDKEAGTFDDFIKSDEFINGKAAMSIQNELLIENMRIAKKKYSIGEFNWNIVSSPVDQEGGGTDSYNVGEIYSIAKQTKAINAAWDLVKFINSEQIATERHKSNNYLLLSRTSLMENKDTGINMQAFYLLPSTKYDYTKLNINLSADNENALRTIFRNESDNFTTGKINVNEAVKNIQLQGDKVFQ